MLTRIGMILVFLGCVGLVSDCVVRADEEGGGMAVEQRCKNKTGMASCIHSLANPCPDNIPSCGRPPGSTNCTCY